MWEYAKTRQDDPNHVKRWFYDEDCDLILWQTPEGEITRFQFCWGKDGPTERVVEWRGGEQLVQHEVMNPIKPTDQGSPAFTNTAPIEVDQAKRILVQNAGELSIDLLYDLLHILHRGSQPGE